MAGSGASSSPPPSVYGQPGQCRCSRMQPSADIALRALEADDGMDAARHGGGDRSRLCGATLFQRGGSRSQGADRPIDAARHPFDQGGLPDSGRFTTPSRHIRARLSNSDGTCIRDYIHVSDLVAAHETALVHLRGGGDSGIFIAAMAVAIRCSTSSLRWSGRPAGRCRSGDAPPRPGDPPAIVAAERARRALGWSPRYDDLDFIVASALEWERRLRRRNAADQGVNG